MLSLSDVRCPMSISRMAGASVGHGRLRLGRRGVRGAQVSMTRALVLALRLGLLLISYVLYGCPHVTASLGTTNRMESAHMIVA